MYRARDDVRLFESVPRGWRMRRARRWDADEIASEVIDCRLAFGLRNPLCSRRTYTRVYASGKHLRDGVFNDYNTRSFFYIIGGGAAHQTQAFLLYYYFQ